MERNDVLIGIVFLFNLVGGGAILKWFFNVEHDRLNMKEEISYLKAGYEKLKTENALLKTQMSEQSTDHRVLKKEFEYIQKGLAENQKSLEEIKGLLTNLLTKK